MIQIGEKASAEVLKRLSPEEIEQIGLEIAQIKKSEPNIAESVLEEFVQKADTGPLSGGKDYAGKLIELSLGTDQSRKFLGKLEGSEGTYYRFEAFKGINPSHIVKFLQNEHPQTIALVVAHLDSAQGAKVFSLLAPDARAEVSLRVAALEDISPDVLDRVAEVLEKKLRTLASLRQETFGGIRAVADILNKIDPTMSRGVLEEMDTKEPEVAVSVRNLMFVFDDLRLLDDAAIRELLKQVDKKDLGLALKGTTEELQDQFFRNMSERAGENLKEEMDLMGPVKLKEVEDSQKSIVEAVKKLEEDGAISINSGDDEYVL